jgi:eukaryotic-like serine/threonine-protein kinase
MIDVTRWTQIKLIFDRAVQLPRAERDEYLRHSCGSDADLRRELDSLLATYDADTGVLDTPALTGAADLIEANIPDAELGREVGPYLVTRRVGEGGMGVVYEATRVLGEPGQRVAIKLVRRGMDSEYILGRFRKERQILASLAHPNIAKLLDGGITGDGLPYFVMEFIEGELIDDYCRSHSLDLARRVGLVRQVCRALEYAHSRHVIHRDIKPGNILVDPHGNPKLLDFGIAKLIATESGEMSQRTATELRIITPDYASPEQIRGEPATERSDVYALGVVLCEIVSGNRASTLAKAPLRQPLPRDLHLIVRKATHEDAGRRYSGMREFAADLDRFLAGESVSAKGDSILYRVSRTIRRPSKLAWAASLVAAALSAAFLSWFVQRGSGFISGSRRAVAVLDFQNVTGAPGTAWFSTALTEMLNAELSAGEKIRIIPGDSVARMKADVGLRPAGGYSTELLHRIGANLHPDYIVAGSYLATGDKSDLLVRVDLRLQDVRTGYSLITWSDTGTPAEFPAIATRAGAKLRQALGITAKPAALARDFSNTETARLYAEGLDRIRSFDLLGARALFERAIADDPSDPLSHAALASALAQLGYEGRAADEAKRAMDLSSGLSHQQSLEVEARYYTLRRDWSNAAATYKTLWTQFPDNLD